MKLTLELGKRPKAELLVKETKALGKAELVAHKLAQLTTGHNELTDLHLHAEAARDSLAAIAGLLRPDATGGHAAVEEAAAKEQDVQRGKD